MAFAFRLLHSAGFGQAGIGDFLDRCATPDLRARSEAVDGLLASFRRWSEADLALLQAAGASEDPDVAAIAGDALERIRVYRSISDGVWRRFSTAGERRRGSPDDVAGLLDVLAGGMRDHETRAEYFEQSGLINPRVGDLAGHLLAVRLGVETPRCWSSGYEDRNENLAFVWGRYRASRGLAPSAFHPAGRGPVPRERVDDLMPALLSDVPAERRTAIGELSRLGDGRWVHLQARLALAAGLERDGWRPP